MTTTRPPDAPVPVPARVPARAQVRARVPVPAPVRLRFGGRRRVPVRGDLRLGFRRRRGFRLGARGRRTPMSAAGDSVVLSAGLDSPGTVTSGPDDAGEDDHHAAAGRRCGLLGRRGARRDQHSAGRHAGEQSGDGAWAGTHGPTLPSPVSGFGTFARRGRCESGGGSVAHYCGQDVRAAIAGDGRRGRQHQMRMTEVGNCHDARHAGPGPAAQQAQQMQAEMERAQASLAEAEVTGSAGSGLVTAVVNGSGDLLRLRIDPSVVDPADVETLEDLSSPPCTTPAGRPRTWPAPRWARSPARWTCPRWGCRAGPARLRCPGPVDQDFDDDRRMTNGRRRDGRRRTR